MHKVDKNMEIFNPEDWKKYLKMIKYIQYGRLPIYFSEGGSDLVFLCVHGAGLSAQSFSLIAEELKPWASLATFDLRGHGMNKSE